MKFYTDKRLEFSSDELEKITGYQLFNNFGRYSVEKNSVMTEEYEEGYIEIINEIREALIIYINKWFIQPRLPEDVEFHTWIWASNPTLHENNKTRAVISWKTIQEETI